jgi:hypothetical protein
MLETFIVFILMLVTAIWAFSESSPIMKFFNNCSQADDNEAYEYSGGTNLPEDSVLKRHFLTHTQTEIESKLHSR